MKGYFFLEMLRCVFNAVNTDALVPKHQGINIHSVDQISIALDQLQTKILHL